MSDSLQEKPQTDSGRDAGALNARPVFLRGREQLADPAAFEPLREDEFPHRASLLDVDRRSVLKSIGGLAVMAGLTASGCRYLPQRKIVPFVRQPEGATPGQTASYASSLELGGYGMGVLVQMQDGHPVRIDGHPDHPASLGSVDSVTMAQLVGLFDPDRPNSPAFKGEVNGWADALDAMRTQLAASGNGAGVALLTETVGSPSLRAQIDRFLKKYPAAQWVQWDPVNRDQHHAGLRAVYGTDVSLRHDFAKADVVLAVDSNFLTEGPGAVRYSRDFMARRQPSAAGGMNRLYAVESVPSNTGVVADHRARLRASAMASFLRALASRLGVPGVGAGQAGVEAAYFEAVAADLQKAGAKGVVVVGDHQLPECHALAALINAHLGSVAAIVGKPVLAKQVDQAAELKSLTVAMDSGQVKMVLILGGNPAYTAPADLGFAARLAKVPHSFRLGLEADETAKAVQWALPMTHPLESWGDTVAFDGTVAVRQPTIQPLYDTMSEIELLDSLLSTLRPGLDIVKQTFADSHPGGDWHGFLAAGLAPLAPAPSGNEPSLATPGPTFAPSAAGLAGLGVADPGQGMELVFGADPCVHDGRFANNSWLQELPKPMSLLVWDNALYVSKKTADDLGVGGQKKIGPVPYLGEADMVSLTVDGRNLDVPVWVNLGQADDVLYLTLGGGRTVGGDAAVSGDEGKGGGFNAYAIRGTRGLWIQGGVQASKSPGSYKLVSTQYHNMLDTSRVDADREIIFSTTPDELAKGGPFAGHKKEGGEKHPPTLYEDYEHDHSKTNYQWAMTIDLSLCTGCNACVTACQSENSIIAVGKEEASRHRAMHWIRVDRYYQGHWKEGDQGLVIDHDNPPIYFQPVTCMHCENAPCEPVCPVAATTHSVEGINQMVYNRCVGTRYCSNNCPYKVRRFNFKDYTASVSQVPILRMLQNPEVTLRGRGVMEKCSYCVQRLTKARQAAKVAMRKVKDREVETACQQACPGKAIMFGDMNRPNGLIAQSARDPRNYALLEELNTRPRTTYLCRVTNPNGALPGARKEENA